MAVGKPTTNYKVRDLLAIRTLKEQNPGPHRHQDAAVDHVVRQEGVLAAERVGLGEPRAGARGRKLFGGGQGILRAMVPGHQRLTHGARQRCAPARTGTPFQNLHGRMHTFSSPCDTFDMCQPPFPAAKLLPALLCFQKNPKIKIRKTVWQNPYCQPANSPKGPAGSPGSVGVLILSSAVFNIIIYYNVGNSLQLIT